MKVALLGESFLLDSTTGVNGTQVQLYNLAHGFKQCGLEVHYVASTGKWTKDYEIVSGIRLHWLKPRIGVLSWIYYMRAYFSVLDQIQPDVVYQRGRSYLTYVAAKWAKRNHKKFIWGSNGEDGCDFWKNTKRLIKSENLFWKKIILSPNVVFQDSLIHKGIRGSDRVINQTESQKLKLLRNFRKQGVVLPSYFPEPEGELGSFEKKKIVLWLANLSPEKRPEIFLRLAEHCQKCNDWQFILAGGSGNRAYFQKISEQAKALRNLNIVGPVPFEQSNKLFSKASLFVNTSKMEAEGLPNTFIQAWLQKTPVLSLIHDPNAWIKSHHLGFCANGDLGDFLAKGKQLLESEGLLEEIGGRCKIFALNTFATEKIIDDYIELFRAA